MFLLLFGEYGLYFVHKTSTYSASSVFLWPHSPICFLSCAVKHFWAMCWRFMLNSRQQIMSTATTVSCSNATHSGLNLLGPSEHEIQTKSSAPGSQDWVLFQPRAKYTRFQELEVVTCLIKSHIFWFLFWKLFYAGVPKRQR